MKVVILAGGLGTRISEETDHKPKPMVEIGGKPILWHIMKIYSHYGFNEFIICLGYKGYVIKEYFSNYFLHQSDVTLDLKNNNVQYHNARFEPWKITLVDTGDLTMTGGRLKRLKGYISEDEQFHMTYGDGVSSIDINELVAFHQTHGALATLTSVSPPGRFGALKFINLDEVAQFVEKPARDGTRINGGFFVLSGKVLDLISDDETIWEQEPLETLASNGELRAFAHNGFWQPMDTLRDKLLLEDLWLKKAAPWKVW